MLIKNLKTDYIILKMLPETKTRGLQKTEVYHGKYEDALIREFS